MILVWAWQPYMQIHDELQQHRVMCVHGQSIIPLVLSSWSCEEALQTSTYVWMLISFGNSTKSWDYKKKPYKQAHMKLHTMLIFSLCTKQIIQIRYMVFYFEKTKRAWQHSTQTSWPFILTLLLMLYCCLMHHLNYQGTWFFTLTKNKHLTKYHGHAYLRCAWCSNIMARADYLHTWISGIIGLTHAYLRCSWCSAAAWCTTWTLKNKIKATSDILKGPLKEIWGKKKTCVRIWIHVFHLFNYISTHALTSTPTWLSSSPSLLSSASHSHPNSCMDGMASSPMFQPMH